MDFIKMIWNVHFEDYSYSDASNIAMNILGNFFMSDVRYDGSDSFRKWALVSEDGDGCGGNITSLEKVGDDITLADSYSEEKIPTKLRMTTEQFVQLFDAWQEKVVKQKPQEVIIKHEEGQFFFETTNQKLITTRYKALS